jgi:drug/metabolite transporter (DMT)-like permease
MTPDRMPQRWRLVAAFGAVYVIWGSTYLAIAFAIQTIPPLLMAGLRFLLAGGVLYLWARVSGAPRPDLRHWRTTLVLGGLFFLCGNGTVVWVERELSSGLTALLVAMVPLWTAILEWLRPGGERPSGPVILGLVLGFAGVAFLVMPGRLAGAEHVNPLWALMLAGSTLAWAAGSVFSRGARLPSGSGLVAGMEMLGGGLLLLLLSVALGDLGRFHPSAVTLRSLLSFLYLAIFGSLITFTAFAWLLKVSTPAKVATAGYVNPMVAVLLGWAIAGDALTLRALIASVVIIVGVAAIVTGQASRRGRNPALRASAESAPARRVAGPVPSREAGV